MRNSIPQLDSFRAYAALLVLLGHHLPWEHLGLPHLRYERMGVTAFFVLSGFLISRILLSYASSIQAGQCSFHEAWRVFFTRRALRIFPLYFFAILFFGVFLGLLRNKSDLWWHLSYSSNIGQAYFNMNFGTFNHFWSLCVEEQFYLLWPLLLFWVGPTRVMPVVWTVVLASLATAVITVALNWESLGYAVTRAPIGVNSFALSIGAILAVYNVKDRSIQNLRLVALPIASILLILVYVSAHLPTVAADRLRDYDDVMHDVAWAIICFFGLDWTVRSRSQFLKNPVTAWIGKISYGIYVYHLLLTVFLWYTFRIIPIDAKQSPVLYALIKIAWTMMLATLSYYGFELFFLNLKDRFRLIRPVEPRAPDSVRVS